MNRAEVFAAIEQERDQQRIKWSGPGRWGSGDCASPNVAPMTKVGVLTEETGEVARAVLDADDANLRTELIQVAAVAVAWLEGMP